MLNTIIVNVNQKKQKINKNIYGHFSEHLGRCIYGGFWVGKDSKIPNINGYRKDVLDAFKNLNIPNLRWPGGCFADEYHWMDGIGPQIERKRMINTHWGGVVEDNSFGTHEFMGLCDELGCEPYICGNVGSGTVQEMSEWVEYMTFSGESPMSKLRESNGHKDPWKLPYFGVGNENWGCGGNMRPEYYADLYRRYQTYVRQYGPDKIFKIAGGPNVDDYNWTEVLMKNAGRFMDGLSLHYYTYEADFFNKKSATEFDELGWIKTLKNALFMDELVTQHSRIMDKYDPEKRVALVVDEWGCWHAAEPGTNPGFLYQQNTMRDALVASITLNIFNNHSDRVRIANIAQAVNVLQSPVLTEGDKMVLTPTYHVLDMYKAHQNADLLSTSCAENNYVYENYAIPGITVSASCAKNGEITVSFCNTDPDKSKTVQIEFAGMEKPLADASATVLAGDAMNSMNTFEKSDSVVPHSCTVSIQDKKTVNLEAPAMSVVCVKVNA